MSVWVYQVSLEYPEQLLSYVQDSVFFAQINVLKEGHNSIIIKVRIMFLAIHVHIVCGNMCTKLCSNTLNGIRVMVGQALVTGFCMPRMKPRVSQ